MPSKWKYSPEGIAASVLFIILFIVILIQIFGRTALFTGPVWTEELARWIWVWMAFLAIGEAERTNSQLKMAFLAERLPAAVRRIIFTLIDLVYLGIMGHLALIGWRTVKRTAINEAVTLPVPDAALYASALIAAVLICYRILRRIFWRLGPGGRDEDLTQEPTL
ncbi:TRAP transporter small permease [Sulfitobacter sp. 915]|uniref:TRAP transporter small permease n=1 Tax=Sulfitobacter sp. 915 TaxID=3368558 RepID=UPI0037457529